MTFDKDRKSFSVALRAYAAKDTDEASFKERMIDLLQYENCFERSLLRGHFTASAWVVDPKQKKVLLTHHAKLNKWLQLGGHADGETNMPKVALKELKEESGSDNFRCVDSEIFDIDIHTIPERGEVPEHEHYDVRYLFFGDADVQLIKNHESKELAWVLFDEVSDKVMQNTSIVRMLNKSLSYLI